MSKQEELLKAIKKKMDDGLDLYFEKGLPPYDGPPLVWDCIRDGVVVDEMAELTDEQWGYLLRRIEVVTPDELAKRFNYQSPTEAAKVLHGATNERLLEDALWFENNLPEGREKSLVHTKLEEVRFWANAAIARNHDKL